jgi:cytochrome o ubiquinol oxidase subunit II
MKFGFKRVYVLMALGVILVLSGCDYDFLLLDPKGPVGKEEKDLIVWSFLIMLLVVVPVIIMSIWFSIAYNEKNTDAEYKPEWSHSTAIEFWVWTIPCLIILALAVLTYKTSHSLDPRKPLTSDLPSVQVQVVALDWKWLFIYPKYKIAVVNEMAMPVDRSIEFVITSDSVMNSFFIPQLGSQIYAMAGMENRLHLMASEVGEYLGMSANYSGYGFSGMKFKAHAVSEEEFLSWVEKVKSSSAVLADEEYAVLAKKSKNNPVKYYQLQSSLLFNSIIEKYTGAQ